MRISVSDHVDLTALERTWRDLEARADGSFFQGWTWTGCLAAERFTDPVLVEATEDGRTIALALFNRRRSRFGTTLFLGESGDPSSDNLAIEYNGVLVEAGRGPSVAAACFAAVGAGPSTRIVLSGVDDVALAGVRGALPLVHVHRTRPTPFADLAPGDDLDGAYLARRSTNTRQQLRRSDRAYAALGPLSVRRAGSMDEAWAMLEAMIPLHQATWVARGRPGCFADPFFGRFHRALIGIGFDRNEIDIMQILAGDVCVGILYNIRYRGAMLAYQSGFDYAAAGKHQPGLTCHHQALLFAAQAGLSRYDFLAGEDRYKRSLADSEGVLHWVEAGSRLSPRMSGLILRRIWQR